MKPYSVCIACLGMAEGASLNEIEVPKGSVLLGVLIGGDNLFLQVGAPDGETTERESIHASIIRDGEQRTGTRWVGSFAYPMSVSGAVPKDADEWRKLCIVHVVEEVVAGVPRRTPVKR
jgi:hypothetical protein